MNEVYRYLKKLTIWTMAGLILFATLVALMGTAKAGGTKGYQSKVDYFVMSSERYVVEMELFLMMPDAKSAKKILSYQEQFMDSMKDISEPVMIACKKDIECNFYLEQGIKNLDNIDYLLPKVLKIMDGKGLI